MSKFTGNGERDLPEILYIMGTGRSGSTILEMLLKNNSGFGGVGELTHIFRDGFLNNEDCACGEKTANCTLWQKVRHQCGWRQEELPSLIELMQSVEGHSSFPALASGLIRKDRLDQYRSVNQKLFLALKNSLNCRVVIDSSKYAGRALALSRLFPGRVRVICLTRSPRALIHAFSKKHKEEQWSKSPFQAMLYYIYVLICCRLTLRLAGVRAQHLRYEDFSSNIQAIIRRIDVWGNYDLTSTRKSIENGSYFSVGHIVTGNRLRKSGKVRFQPDTTEACNHGIASGLAIVIMNLCRIILRF